MMVTGCPGQKMYRKIQIIVLTEQTNTSDDDRFFLNNCRIISKIKYNINKNDKF